MVYAAIKYKNLLLLLSPLKFDDQPHPSFPFKLAQHKRLVLCCCPVLMALWLSQQWKCPWEPSLSSNETLKHCLTQEQFARPLG
jgi:hypothetical protein